jgi:hypothetical protein
VVSICDQGESYIHYTKDGNPYFKIGKTDYDLNGFEYDGNIPEFDAVTTIDNSGIGIKMIENNEKIEWKMYTSNKDND